MRLKIRQAKSGEAKILSELAFRSKAYWGYSDVFIESCRKELNVTPKKIRDKKFNYFIGEGDRGLIGYYALEHISDSQFELEALYIDPKYMRKGFGNTLISHAKELVFRNGGLDIIIQGDPNAKPFYKSIGCYLVGEK